LEIQRELTQANSAWWSFARYWWCTTWCTTTVCMQLCMVSQCKLVSGWGMK